VAGAFDTKNEALSFRSYLFTKIVRFLILQTVISQDVNRKNFRYVPDLGAYKGEYTDEILRNLWGITEEEWDFIDSRILPANG
jgi:site-specific DNA-methyltransferase (adenine-specific)